MLVPIRLDVDSTSGDSAGDRDRFRDAGQIERQVDRQLSCPTLTTMPVRVVGWKP